MENERKVEVKARSGKKTALIVICVLAVLVLGVAGVAGVYLNGMLGAVNHVEVASPVYTEPAEAPQETQDATAPTEPVPAYAQENTINYLVVCEPVKDGTAKKTDTMILCSLNTKAKVLTMTALQPDVVVKTPAYGKHAGGEEAALNTIYGLGATYGSGTAGSMEFLNQTLYDNYGIKVDQNLEIDMKLFSRVVGRIGGVTVDLTAEEAAYLSETTKKDIQAGAVEMNESLAQSYVKMWGDEEAEGVSSAAGQRKLVAAILKVVKSVYVADLKDIVMDCLPMITTSMSKDELEDTLFMVLAMLHNLSIENGGTYPAA